MGNVNIIVMLDEGDISAVKVNNELFFRKENEDVVDFYNYRIIPLLNKKGIDFVSNYKTDNITVIEEKDYSFEKKDNINITEEQMEKIVNCLDRNELSYDEQLYLSMLHKKIYGSYDFYNQSQFESAKKLVWYIWRGETIQKLYEYKELENEIYEELAIKELRDSFKLDKYDNPLFTNNVIGKVVNGIRRSSVNIDTYSLITGRTSYDNSKDSNLVNFSDMLKFENMKFKLYKEKCYRKSKDERILEFSDNPFKDINSLKEDKKELYDRLHEIYSDENFIDDEYWDFYFSVDEILESDITHSIYINIPIEKIYELNIKLCEMLNDSDVSYITKFTTKEKRTDSVTIYSDKENILKILDIIKQIFKEEPSLFSEKESIMTSASIGVPGVGVGAGDKILESSHNNDLAYVIDRALSVSVLNYILKNGDDKAKNAFVNGLSHIFSVILDEDVHEKIEDNFEKIAYKLLGALKVVPLEFEEKNINSRNQLLINDAFVDSNNMEVPIREEILFIVIKDAIKACSNPRKVVGLTEKEIMENADFYDVHPYNIAFNYDSNENKYGKNKISFY